MPNFLEDFSRKIFLTLYSINWSNFIVRLPLLFEILGSVYILIICFSVSDVINFKIKLGFLINSFFFYDLKSQDKNLNTLITKREFSYDMVKHELRITVYELRVTNYKLQVESLKARVKIQKCDFRSTSYEFKSTSSRIINQWKLK